jgi:hypothetical protein
MMDASIIEQQSDDKTYALRADRSSRRRGRGSRDNPCSYITLPPNARVRGCFRGCQRPRLRCLVLWMFWLQHCSPRSIADGPVLPKSAPAPDYLK